MGILHPWHVYGYYNCRPVERSVQVLDIISALSFTDGFICCSFLLIDCCPTLT